ncbi:MAG: nucleoside-diphosphate kinase [Alphaproteobacteria bacterium]|nr:MAG: nucleoside-diphosphate kinase [Alphaproteobacteria bacterium]
MERTLSILKPDVTKRNLTGEVNTMIEKAGFKIIAQKKIRMTPEIAGGFYGEHREKPFFGDLCRIMSAAPVVVQVLEKHNAIELYRHLMGATNPEKADEGTIRKKYGISLDENSVHGSDSAKSAEREISFFFSDLEIVG